VFGVEYTDPSMFFQSYEPSYKENAVIGKLTIRNFLPSDEATYSCVAGNDAGQKSVDFTITGKKKTLAIPLRRIWLLSLEIGIGCRSEGEGRIGPRSQKGFTCCPLHIFLTYAFRE